MSLAKCTYIGLPYIRGGYHNLRLTNILLKTKALKNTIRYDIYPQSHTFLFIFYDLK